MLRLALLLALGVPLAPALAAPSYAEAGTQARDRQAILAMAGTFKVSFDMRETVAFVPGYTLYPAKLSGGYEVVRVIADRPDFVSLQHLLVVGDPSSPIVVKHWRQDWTWQPKSVLVYAAANRWTLEPVAEADRRGAWSQTVWQTDDSPRYGAVGRWRYDGGVARWMSAETRRPLARRDATRHPPYDHYIGTNRHALTPEGWVHEQDNAKIGTKDGKEATFAHEVLLNRYVPATDFPVAAADDYWRKTSGYWAGVREQWDAIIARNKGVTLPEEAEFGSITGKRLMALADAVAEGKPAADAEAEAQRVMTEATR